VFSAVGAGGSTGYARHYHEDVCVVTLPELGTVESAAFRHVLRTACEHGANKVIVDLASVISLEPSALGVILDCGKKLEDDGGEFVVVARDPNLLGRFQETRLDRVLRIEPTLTLACRSISVYARPRGPVAVGARSARSSSLTVCAFAGRVGTTRDAVLAHAAKR
jgi:anti-anti-sigma factor